MPSPPLADDAQEIGGLLMRAVGQCGQSCLLIIHVTEGDTRGRVSVTRSSRCDGPRQRTVDGRTLVETLRTLVGNEETRTCPKCEKQYPLKDFNRNGYCLGCEVQRAREIRARKRELLAASRRRERR